MTLEYEVKGLWMVDVGHLSSCPTARRSSTVERLADLIDPTCVMRPVLEGFRCSACGTHHDMSGFEEFPWPRCPECGARVVSGGSA